MYEKLRSRVEELFENAPKTRRANELKEELLANIIDKYRDLIANGKSEEEAINRVIEGIGDVDELIKGLKENDIFSYEQMQKQREKTALITSISIGLYIMSIVVLILFTAVLGIDGTISVCLMLTIDAAATCLLIYHFTSRPRYIKADNTMVEEFKEWKSTNTKKNEVYRSIRSLVWTITVALYFILSFMFDCWAYSWIIFIIGAAVQKIVTLTFLLEEKK